MNRQNRQALYSPHDIEELIRSKRSLSECELVHSSDLNRREKNILSLSRDKNIPCRHVSQAEFTRLSAMHGKRSGKHSGVLLLVPGQLLESQSRLSDLWSLLKEGTDPVLLILAGITDPHNLGAIIRSADLFEVRAVIVPKRRSAALNDAARRVSAGASHHVPLFYVANVIRIIDELKEEGFWVYSADLQGSAPTDVDLTGRIAIVMGNEEQGIAREINKHVDGTLTIPTAGHIDSCNVSVATGIMLYELRRQRGFFPKRHKTQHGK